MLERLAAASSSARAEEVSTYGVFADDSILFRNSGEGCVVLTFRLKCRFRSLIRFRLANLSLEMC